MLPDCLAPLAVLAVEGYFSLLALPFVAAPLPTLPDLAAWLAGWLAI